MRAAARRFARGERIDVQAVVTETGVGRATVHRWFGTRERLVGEALLALSEPLMPPARERATGHGAEGLVNALDGIVAALVADEGLRRFLEHERDAALRLLTNSGGTVQPAWVVRVRELIDAATTDAWRPPMDPDTLAYAIVRLTEAFLYHDAAVGLRGDVDRLRDVLAALLGLRR